MKSAETGTPFWIPATWPAPSTIKAGVTTRQSGYSSPPYDGLNLATHVGDEPAAVQRNRQLLRQRVQLPADPLWLRQTHSNSVVTAAGNTPEISADGIFTNEAGVVCVVLTADCVPLLLCNRSGTEIAAIHVGWRGLTTNIIANGIERFTSDSGNLLAWVGPHIGAEHYEVGAEVRSACMASIHTSAESAFVPTRPGHWRANLAQLVQLNLTILGVSEIYFSGRCTYREATNFYSYRREQKTGRMASLIWIER